MTLSPEDQADLDRQLVDAASRGDSGQAEKLVAAGADIEVDNQSPIVQALKSGHTELAVFLTEKRGEKDHSHILQEGISHRRKEFVEYLLDKGTPVIDAENFDAIFFAAYVGDADIAEMLLKRGANPNARASLLHAVSRNHADTVRVLLDYGADMYGDNDKAITTASLRGYSEVVAILAAKDGGRGALYKDYLDGFRYRAETIATLPENECREALFGPEGKPTDLLKAFAASRSLPALFPYAAWKGRIGEAEALYKEIRSALPEHYQAALHEVDTNFFLKAEPAPVLFAAKLQQPTLNTRRR